MELSSFSENIVSVPYERSGQTVSLEINIDAFTPEFFRQVGKKFEERMKDWKAIDAKAKPRRKAKKSEPNPVETAKAFFEDEATTLEVKRQIYAELLAGGVLKGWDVTENDLPIVPSVEVLLKLPPLLVEDIWNLALEKAKTVKKRVDEETEAISENSPSGSRAPLALAPTG
jgi:hypothetical protein